MAINQLLLKMRAISARNLGGGRNFFTEYLLSKTRKIAVTLVNGFFIRLARYNNM